MGKKRQRSSVGEHQGEDTSQTKKSRHKKNKHKKRKYVEEDEEDDEEEEGIGLEPKQEMSVVPVASKPLTLKIKLGSEVLTPDSKSSDQLSVEDVTSSFGESSIKSSHTGAMEEDWIGSDDISVGGESFPHSEDEKLDMQDDAEEEAWLNALETGGVNERGYLPQKKDPTSLTARQRAMMGSKEVQLLELPLKKVPKEETEEMLLKKTERNRKRRIQAIKRREKHKADTVQKLLQKQSTKKKDEEKPRSVPKVSGPHVRYISNTVSGCSLSLTAPLEFPLVPQTAVQPAPPVLCSVEGCNNVKKYSDSISHLPLCSLECYKKLHNSRTLQPLGSS